MDFGKRLEGLLAEKKLSQKRLAEMLNLRRPLISEWKRNGSFPYADTAVRIAGILNTTVEYLVTGKPPAGVSEKALDIARTADRLDDVGKMEALHLVQSLEALHPLEKH